MQRNRSWRRAQRENKIAEVERWMADWNWCFRGPTWSFEERRLEIKRDARRRYTAPCKCSRYCCGNPRIHFGTKTLPEIRFDMNCEEEYNEYEIRKDFRHSSKGW